MNYLLDTHVFLWWLSAPEKLLPEEMKIVSDPKNIIYISAASIWEIKIKTSLGKLTVPDEIHESIEQQDFFPLSITVEHAHKIGKLPRIHDDPFDRMLVAQAHIEELILITRDENIKKYAKSSINKCKTALTFGDKV